MADLTVSRFSPESHESLDIGSLIGAPLVAAASANGMMAREQAKFLMDVCFSKDGDSYRPVMVTMILSRGYLIPGDPPAIKRVTNNFQVPLLTLISISALAVETVDVKFEMDILMQRQTSTSEDSAEKSESAGKLFGRIGKQIQGEKKQSSQSASKESSSTSLTVEVHAAQLPLPTGLTSILELYTKAIHPSKSGGANADGSAPDATSECAEQP